MARLEFLFQDYSGDSGTGTGGGVLFTRLHIFAERGQRIGQQSTGQSIGVVRLQLEGDVLTRNPWGRVLTNGSLDHDEVGSLAAAGCSPFVRWIR